MNGISSVRRALILLSAVAVLGTGMASTASAHSAWSLLYDQNSAMPNGYGYSDGWGQPISAEIDGYDRYGNLVQGCQTRAYYTGSKSTVQCSTDAIAYQAFLVSTNHQWCATTRNSWSGLIVECNSGPIFVHSTYSGDGYYNIEAFGRGQ